MPRSYELQITTGTSTQARVGDPLPETRSYRFIRAFIRDVVIFEWKLGEIFWANPLRAGVDSADCVEVLNRVAYILNVPLETRLYDYPQAEPFSRYRTCFRNRFGREILNWDWYDCCVCHTADFSRYRDDWSFEDSYCQARVLETRPLIRVLGRGVSQLAGPFRFDEQSIQRLRDMYAASVRAGRVQTSPRTYRSRSTPRVTTSPLPCTTLQPQPQMAEYEDL